ncbi:MAG: malate synthase A [Methylacidiphilaceae bacterium]|nr:malate synthase A [Candidatus Methylacidiphilaceae bacterium]
MAKSPQISNVELLGPLESGWEEILSPEALRFVADLQREFGATRSRLLRERPGRWQKWTREGRPAFREDTGKIREGAWKVNPAPDQLQNRRVEITGPSERKMMINALNSGANVFMADLEDAYTPTWSNVILGQKNIKDAVRRRIQFDSPEGKSYRLGAHPAVLMVRPRGWHLVEKHALVDGQPLSGSLFDFGLAFFHNAREQLARGTGPYFYLPKLEAYEEAELWASVFRFAEDALSLSRGTIKATVLIETIPAAFQMEEILYALRDHICGLNAGRWDYIFSAIKQFCNDNQAVLPDRDQVTMTVPFMRAYTELLVHVCHKRGAHAMGGMAAFIPSRRDAALNDRALAKVREDKERECKDGFDGTWVAHPDLVPVAREVFDRVLVDRPNQKERLREDVRVVPADLVDFAIPGGTVTEAGVRNNISVGLQYLSSWLSGNGAAAIFHLMEDTATAEISRAQLWQWLRHRVELSEGQRLTRDLYVDWREEERRKLGSLPHLGEASQLLDDLVLTEEFIAFLTIPAYERYIA